MAMIVFERVGGNNLFNHHQSAASTWMMQRQPYTFTFINLADAFIHSDLQLRNTISNTL